ncbi:heavy metal translocating P-type ATPase [Parasutterella secunda]|uniref:heavy metal translocating P-type ATPase n=1 Tax=Parasutterella secunda TaxID=626947 RepID=UPI0025A39481|nr:heavy metal translocating P-type ATPase [Parasutterella secunda]MDM8112095.1 heavy metal translocating P-type ATPase [Parasutterella secunda]MDM8218738.1 heavy metal translocating P-type ATPase [Parasutterella secunda]
MKAKQKKMLIRIIIASVLLIALALSPVTGYLRLALFLIPYLIVGYDILLKAAKGFTNGRIFDENLLMTVATLGAIAIALYDNTGDYTEAVAVMLFYQIGEWFQGYAVGKSRKNISELMDIRPDYANIEKDGQLIKVDPDEVQIGDIIVVQPGEKVPLDGVVIEGESSLNTSALTGESLPRSVSVDDEITSGCINLSGLLKIRTTKLFGDSTVSQILELVENASSRKSRSEAFITRFARVYTPIVFFSALALAVIPPLVRLLGMGLDAQWDDWIYRSLVFLVISCPCALVISIPLSFFAGIGGASNQGILVKGSNFLENLSETKVLVFDKTGTLTEGVFEVVAIHHNKLEEKKLLELAALAESASSHPISKSLQKAYGLPLNRDRVKDIHEISGQGVVAKIDDMEVAAGNEKLMKSLNVEAIACHSVGTIVHIAINGEYHGHIVISDRIKAHAKETIRAVKKAGIQKTVMLSGDSRKVAEHVAKELGIDEVRSELMPADKVRIVEELLEQNKSRGKLAFVGDGINDAPVLSRADIGIAMGAMGSDAAIEAADVVLMDDDPLKIAKGIKISRKCLAIVKENIWFAIGIKVACLILGAFGIANMWMAIFADVGVMILAILNAIRALFVKNL